MKCDDDYDDGDIDDDDDVNEGINGFKIRDWEEMEDGVIIEDIEYLFDK